MREDAGNRLRIESNLRTALESGEIYAAFEPQHNLRTGKLVRFEALCRWRNKELGEVGPARFIPVAEEIGVINAIGRLMLREACSEAFRWQQAGSAVSVAVNVSPVEFARHDFIDALMGVLGETGLDPSRLELELTEGVLIRDFEHGLAQTARLRRLGVRIAVDDFGTGYSSLGYLQRLPVDALKIDCSFVRDLDRNAQSVSMVRAIIAMARALGLRVVTEGVETGLNPKSCVASDAMKCRATCSAGPNHGKPLSRGSRRTGAGRHGTAPGPKKEKNSVREAHVVQINQIQH